MDNFNTQAVNELDFDFDDYFMQNIVNLSFKKNILTIKVVKRKALKFFNVKFIFTSLNIFKNNKDIILYSLYVKRIENDFQINARFLINGQLQALDFTATKIEF